MNTTKQLAGVFNLSDYEARLYIAAQGDSSTVSDLAKLSGIPRTAVYPPLNSLVAKGFLSPLKTKEKRLRYQAVEPKYLKTLFSRRLTDLDDVIEQFGSMIAAASGEVSVRYFEGRNGIITAASIFMQESKSKVWKTFEDPNLVERLVGTKQFDEYVKERVRRGIVARVILPAKEHSPWVRGLIEKSKEKLIELRLVSPHTYPINATIVVSNDWIFLECAVKKPFAILVKNESLARTIESIHDMV